MAAGGRAARWQVSVQHVAGKWLQVVHWWQTVSEQGDGRSSCSSFQPQTTQQVARGVGGWLGGWALASRVFSLGQRAGNQSSWCGALTVGTLLGWADKCICWAAGLAATTPQPTPPSPPTRVGDAHALQVGGQALEPVLVDLRGPVIREAGLGQKQECSGPLAVCLRLSHIRVGAPSCCHVPSPSCSHFPSPYLVGKDHAVLRMSAARYVVLPPAARAAGWCGAGVTGLTIVTPLRC